ncbi:hypothetical protein R6Z07F_013393 [Ovis aries]
MDCSPPGSSVHGISQARILEWVAISFSRGYSRNRTGISGIAGRFLRVLQQKGERGKGRKERQWLSLGEEEVWIWKGGDNVKCYILLSTGHYRWRCGRADSDRLTGHDRVCLMMGFLTRQRWEASSPSFGCGCTNDDGALATTVQTPTC